MGKAFVLFFGFLFISGVCLLGIQIFQLIQWSSEFNEAVLNSSYYSAGYTDGLEGDYSIYSISEDYSYSAIFMDFNSTDFLVNCYRVGFQDGLEMRDNNLKQLAENKTLENNTKLPDLIKNRVNQV